MRKAITILSLIIAGSLFMSGFKAPSHNSVINKRTMLKWKSTIWVNPFAQMKKKSTIKLANTATVDFYHECITPANVFRYRIFINNNEYQGCGVPMGLDSYSAWAGTNVSIEMDVHMIYGMYYINIDDYDGMGGSVPLFYADSPAYITYTFPVVAGHTYYVYTITY